MSFQNSLPPCINGTFRGLVRYCGQWHCLRHGYWVRLRRALRHLKLIPGGWEAWVSVLHPNRRLNVEAVGRIAETIRQRARRLFPEAVCTVFVHVSGSSGEGLSPYPHFHVLVYARPGVLTGDGLESLKGIVTHTKSLGRSRILPWEKVRSLQAKLLYLYQATKEHKDLPPDELPRRGDRYRQVYGMPRGLPLR